MRRLLLVGLSVFALFAAQSAVQAQGKSMTTSGTVKSVSGSSLVVTAKGGKDMTFAVDNTTKFVGKGLGTKAKEGAMTATDAVHDGDRVSVTYHDMGGTMHAASVRITAKASVKK